MDYDHLLNEGEITNGQTVYLNKNDFNGYDFLEFEVREGSGGAIFLLDNLCIYTLKQQ